MCTDEPILGVHTVGIHISAQNLSLDEIFKVPEHLDAIPSGVYYFQKGWLLTKVRVEKKSLETQSQ